MYRPGLYGGYGPGVGMGAGMLGAGMMGPGLTPGVKLDNNKLNFNL